MKIRILTLGLLTASCLLAEELPLPMTSPLPQAQSAPELLKPTVIIKPPPLSQSVAPAPLASREMTLLEMERQLLDKSLRLQIVQSQRDGSATQLKQIILMSGPVDAAVSRATKPPPMAQGRVTLIGLPPSAMVSKSLDQFFGVILTPDRERQVLETVKTHLAVSEGRTGMDVSIAGWWPKEGVLAVSVAPRS